LCDTSVSDARRQFFASNRIPRRLGHPAFLTSQREDAIERPAEAIPVPGNFFPNLDPSITDDRDEAFSR
jgi:hypothetical protein